MPVRLQGRAAERLENRPAGIRAELEAAIDVELVHRADQGHVAFADDLGEIHVAQPRPLGHRQHQREVGADEVFAEVLEAAMPFQELFGPVCGSGRLFLISFWSLVSRSLE